jgi:siroheme synthase-like protein
VLWTGDPAAAGDLVDRAAVTAHSGAFEPDLLNGTRIAIVDTGNRQLDRQIASEARARQVLVNVVDDPTACDWSAPAILRRGDLTIAIASAGIAPALASRLRDRLRSVIGPEYGELVSIFGEVRPRILASGRSFTDRRRLWYALVDGPALELLRAGQGREAREAVRTAVSAWEARR